LTPAIITRVFCVGVVGVLNSRRRTIMGKGDKSKLLEFLAGLDAEDQKTLEEAWLEKFGKRLSADDDFLATLRTLQGDVEALKKGAKPPEPPAKKKGFLQALTEALGQ
jgi:hypothetical protein